MGAYRLEDARNANRSQRDDKSGFQTITGCIRRLQALAMNGGTLLEATGLLAEWCHGAILIRNPAGRILAQGGPVSISLPPQAPGNVPAAARQAGSLMYERPLLLDGRLFATLTLALSDRPGDRSAIELIDAAVPPLLMILMQSRISERTSQRERLLQDLVTGRLQLTHAALAQAAQFGIDLAIPCAPCVFRPNGRPAANALDSLNDAVRAALNQAPSQPVDPFGEHPLRRLAIDDPLLVRLPDSLVLLCPGDEEDRSDPSAIEAACRALHAALSEALPAVPCSIGIGRTRAEADMIAMGCLEARRAVETGERICSGGGVFRYDDFAFESILSQLTVDDEISLFVEAELGPLLDGDAKSQLLLATLEELLSGPNHSDMASRLLVHPKTITHRKLGIERLLGRSLDDSATRRRLSLALALYRLNREFWPGHGGKEA